MVDRPATGTIPDGEVQATHADGSDRWFGVRAANLSNNPPPGAGPYILQDVVRRSETLDHLSVIASFTCDKMRPDTCLSPNERTALNKCALRGPQCPKSCRYLTVRYAMIGSSSSLPGSGRVALRG